MLAITLIAAALTIGYGILHDLVAIRISPEYFTVARPPPLSTDSATLLAAAWGVSATWWVALPLGLALGLAATSGPRAQAPASEVARALACALGLTAGFAALAGMVGFLAASSGLVRVVGPLARRLSPAARTPFVAVLWTQLAAYAAGGVLAAVLVARTWRARRLAPLAGRGA